MGQLLQDGAWRKHITQKNQEQFSKQNLPNYDKTKGWLLCH